VAWKPLGWQAAWFSEIEPFPSAVLAHHYPAVPNLGSMVALPERVLAGEVEAPDLLCGGTPCQAFSVAGLRRSLDDARGNLSLTFCELADAIDTVRSARGQQPSIVFWENVPGVLSTADNAFGCFLGRLAGSGCELKPAGKRWTDAGCVLGPARAVAWRILDAQYFGLAQRRRRVFVVASARNGFDPAAVLFELEGMRRDLAPRREARQGNATIPARSSSGGGLGTDFDCDGGLIPKVAGALDLECGGGKLTHQSLRNGHLIGTITARMFCALGARDVEEGAILAVDAHNQVLTGSVFKTVDSRDDQDTASLVLNRRVWVPCSCCEDFWCSLHNKHTADCDCPPLEEWETDPYGLQVEGPAAVTWVQEVADPITTHEGSTWTHEGTTFRTRNVTACEFEPGAPSYTLTKRHSHAVMDSMAVRRLTPRECERLQGFPDDYTAIPWRKQAASECPDGPRYKALGNSWAVPVVRWIGQRISKALAKPADRKANAGA